MDSRADRSAEGTGPRPDAAPADRGRRAAGALPNPTRAAAFPAGALPPAPATVDQDTVLRHATEALGARAVAVIELPEAAELAQLVALWPGTGETGELGARLRALAALPQMARWLQQAGAPPQELPQGPPAHGTTPADPVMRLHRLSVVRGALVALGDPPHGRPPRATGPGREGDDQSPGSGPAPAAAGVATAEGLALAATAVEAAILAQRATERARQLGRELARTGETLSQILETGASGILSLDEAGKIVFVNETAQRLLGAAGNALVGRDVATLARLGRSLDGRQLARADLPFDRVRQTGQPVYNFRFVLPPRQGNARQRTLSLNAAQLDPTAIDGMRVAFLLTDVTDAFEAEAESRRNELLLQSLFALSPSGIAMSDTETLMIRMLNPAMRRMMGVSDSHICVEPLPFIFAGDAGALAERMRQRLRDVGRFGPVELDLKRADGQPDLPVSFSAVIFPERRGLRKFWAVIQDVSDRRREAERLRHQALHDHLTGLPNRKYFVDRLENAIADARASGRRGAVAVIDLDSFKQINDSLGHMVGDAFLQSLTQMLKTAMRGKDFVARFGGDEFAVILPDIDGRAEAQAIATRILRALTRTLTVQQHELRSGASIGVSLYPDDGDEPKEVLRRADEAMYVSKSGGGGMVTLHEPGIEDRTDRRKLLLDELRQAEARLELSLHYQPIYDLRIGTVASVEALLRWQPEGRPPVLPEQFITIAESSNLIGALRRFSIAEALAQAKRWRADGIHLPVFVNLSPAQIRSDEDLDDILDQIAGHREHDRLVFEVTETAAFQDDLHFARLQRLRSAGVRIAIDDFGAGFSTLEYLAKIPAEFLKIDRGFVAGLPAERYRKLVSAIIALGHGFGMKVIAEGIETLEQRDLLRELGCDLGQGFVLARPQPADRPDLFTPRPMDP